MMDISESEARQMLEKLDKYSQMSDGDEFTADEMDLESLSKIYYLIEGENFDRKIEFFTTVEHLRNLKKKYSFRFGEIVINSSRLINEGNLDGALGEIDRFIEASHSPFFIDQAKRRRDFLLKSG